VLGKPPTTMATLEEAIVVIKALVEGRTIAYEGTDLHLPWAGRWTLPVWVAGYGPMALAMTGRVADGLILQLADPDLIRWFVDQVREAAAGAGRDPSSIAVQAAAAGYIGPDHSIRYQASGPNCGAPMLKDDKCFSPPAAGQCDFPLYDGCEISGIEWLLENCRVWKSRMHFGRSAIARNKNEG
jgi:hypothetical protein